MTDPASNLDINEINVDLTIQEILLAASQHNVSKLRSLIRSFHTSRSEDHNAIDAPNPVNVKDPETGYSPLHAAIAACEKEGDEEAETNGLHNGDLTNGNHATSGGEEADPLQLARDTVRFLLQEGAIWNDLDKNDETPGCVARRLGLKELYELMVDAGVRAELLFSRLEGYEQLEDEDENMEEVNEEAKLVATETPEMTATTSGDDETQAEQRQQTSTESPADDVTQSRYLDSNLTFQPHRLLDADQNGVMMSWETSIMSVTAQKLLPRPGLRVLNIGHGMGIIDSLFQDRRPVAHHIVEAHPDVITEMKRQGWHEKPGVQIHEGPWQDVLPGLVDSGETFDAIYYDTFAESYANFRQFFSEYVIALLDSEVSSISAENEGTTDTEGPAIPTPTTKWSFFNGMGADRQVSYDVYQKVVEMDLFEAGFDVEWEDIQVPDLTKEWSGVRRPYWLVDKYRLPICRFMD